MAELALAIIGLSGTVDVCVKLGKFIIQACRDYDQADVKLHELTVRMEVCCSRISCQLEVTKQLETKMNEEVKYTETRTLRVLMYKLDSAANLLKKSEKYASSITKKRLHFLGLRDNLEDTVLDLESWQKRYEPTWFQLVKTAPSDIDGVLENVAVSRPRIATDPTREALQFRRAFEDVHTVFIAEKTLESLDKTAIPYCAAQIAADSGGSKRHIIDTVSTEIVKMKDAREFAGRLRDASPLSSGILKCKGIVRRPKDSSLVFVFRVPDGYSNVRSVRERLLSGPPPDSLTIRLEMARQLAAATYFVHLYEFVHKNICPETILSLEKVDGGVVSTIICLVGFQVIRHADAKTNTSKTSRKDSLYQHSSRQGENSIEFIMQHDIYSLGVCLLEIGLWESLAFYQQDGTMRLSDTVGIDQSGTQPPSPSLIQQQLVSLSRDDGNVDFGDPTDFQDEDGVEVGVRYVKKVLDILSMVSF